VFADWTTFPFKRVWIALPLVSEDLTIQGPSGQKVSKPLARVHCPSLFWRSLAVTSFRQVRPKMAPGTSSSGMFLQVFPMTTANSPS
jgi:hypothetical protein